MPFIPLVISFFIVFSFFFVQEIIRGHYPGVVTALPTSTFTVMIRLARDETPFPLAMQPKVTALAW
jgi:hypothetical protein